MNFKEFLKLDEQNTVGTHNDYATGAFLSSDVNGSDGGMGGTDRKPPFFGLDLVPTITRQGRIKFIEMNKNPILILLTDGTRLHLTWDEYKRIGKEPQVGKTMVVVFQRFPGDASESLSQIQSIEIY
jgi:hypothetical protein